MTIARHSIAYERPEPHAAVSLAMSAVQGLEKAFIVVATLFFSNLAVFLLVGNTPGIDESASAVARLSWYPIYLGVLIFSGLIAVRFIHTLANLTPIYILLAITLVSCVWSVEPDISERRAIAQVFTIFFGLYLVLRGRLYDSLALVGVGLFIMALINLVVVLAMPGIGVDQDVHAGAWKGVTMEKNQLGADMSRAALVFAALAYWRRGERWIWSGAFTLAVLLVLGTTSKTALISLLAPLALFLLFVFGRRGPGAALLALYFGIVGVGGVLTAIVFAPEQVSALIGRDLTLTGRTDIWALAIDAIGEHPWTGYGQGAFWYDTLGPSYTIRDTLQWTVPTAHSSWLEIGLALGVPGMVMAAVIMIGAGARHIARMVSREDPWPFVFLVQLFLISLSESVLWEPNFFVSSWFAFVAGAGLVSASRVYGQRSVSAR